MGSCLAVEVREQPAPYYGRSGQPRHTVVRQKNKSAYRISDESSLYRPRSRLSVRRDDYRSQDDFRTFDNRQDDYNDHYRSPAQAEYRNDRPFEPLPPPVPPVPLIHDDHFRNNNLQDHGIVDLGVHQPNHHNEIPMIDDPVEVIRRSPQTHRGRRQMVVHSSRRGGHERRYYDDSDDDSWVERSPRSGYSDDSWVEVYRPGRRRSSRRTSRSRNNSRYHR